MTHSTCRIMLTLATCASLSACTTAATARANAARASAHESLRRTLQAKLDSMRASDHLTGVTFGIALADGSSFALASGESDTAKHIPMRPTDRMLQGSVGKTYVAALAMQLVAAGKLDLDETIGEYVSSEPWYQQLVQRHPTLRTVTVRELMRHTSGLVRYEFQPAAMAALRANPYKEWTPTERIQYIYDQTPPFEPGQGWEYSDTNYIVLGVILEHLLGMPYYYAVRTRILGPLGLENTIPSDRRNLPRVVNGYAGPHNDLGGYDASIQNGLLAVNPQFEWTGGGMASSADDLARWGKMLYEGQAFDSRVLPLMLQGVPAKLGPNTSYGLGVIIRDTPSGPFWGHSGFFPGYATEMLYDPRAKIAFAIQANITQPYPRGLVRFLLAADAAAIAEH
jgi:D-alanyl-D-alanine carboxypeptidase